MWLAASTQKEESAAADDHNSRGDRPDDDEERGVGAAVIVAVGDFRTVIAFFWWRRRRALAGLLAVGAVGSAPTGAAAAHGDVGCEGQVDQFTIRRVRGGSQTSPMVSKSF